MKTSSIRSQGAAAIARSRSRAAHASHISAIASVWPSQRKKAAYRANSIGSRTMPMNSTRAGSWKPTAVSQCSTRRRPRPRALTDSGGGRSVAGPLGWCARNVEVSAG